MRRVMSVLVLCLLAPAATSCERGTAPIEVTGPFNPAAPGFIVRYHNGVDPVTTTALLEKKYNFTATHVYTALPGFAAELSTAALYGVQREPTVSSIAHDNVVTFANP